MDRGLKDGGDERERERERGKAGLHHYQPTQWLLTDSTHLSQHLCTYMHIVCFVCCFIYYFNCVSFAIRLSGRKVAIKLVDWMVDWLICTHCFSSWTRQCPFIAIYLSLINALYTQPYFCIHFLLFYLTSTCNARYRFTNAVRLSACLSIQCPNCV